MKKPWVWLHTALAATLLASAANPVFADDSVIKRPIRLEVGASPGGGGDIIARLISKPFSDAIKQTVIVENRPGAGGIIAEDYVAHAAPDGTTLSLSFPAHVTNPILYKHLPFDPIKDFTPITMLARNLVVLIVPANSPLKTVGQFLEAGKNAQRPLKDGVLKGGTPDLANDLLGTMTGFHYLSVPYKGNSPAVVDLLGGRLDYMFITYAEVQGQAKSGVLRVLAVTDPKRSELLPDVPTIEEAGVKGFSAFGWYGVLAPKGTPRPVVEALNKALVAAVHSPDVTARLKALGDEPVGSTPEYLASFIESEIARWNKVAKEAHIEPQ